MSSSEGAARAEALPEVGSIEQLDGVDLDFEIGGLATVVRLEPGVSRPNLYSRELAAAAVRESFPFVVDAGCGSGAIGLFIAMHSSEHPRVVCADVDRDAVDLTRRNVERCGLASQVEVIQSDWLSSVPSPLGRELVVASPPHTPCPIELLNRESNRSARYAQSAFGGTDGLASIGPLMADVSERGSTLMLSVGGYLVRGISDLAESHGYEVQVLKRRLAAMSLLALELRTYIEASLGFRFAQLGEEYVNEVTVIRVRPASSGSSAGGR